MIERRVQISILCIALMLALISSGTCCSKGEWKCKSGDCVEMDLLCDGSVDCSDGSDETYDLCHQFFCPWFAFRCAYGACVSAAAKCDTIQDCADNSDETDISCEYTAVRGSAI